MKIRIGQVFRVEHPTYRATLRQEQEDPVASYYELTRGQHALGADINKGIWSYKSVKLVDGSGRRPAVLVHSNPFKEDSLDVPWIDIIDPDSGYAIYNGDNRKPVSSLDARGNALLDSLAKYYSFPQYRLHAPPILVFTQRLLNGNRRGYREFSGYGVPTRYILQSQSRKGSKDSFSNLVLELALFNLDAENGWFDWAWIDARRDRTKTDEEVLKLSPQPGDYGFPKVKMRLNAAGGKLPGIVSSALGNRLHLRKIGFSLKKWLLTTKKTVTRSRVSLHSLQKE